MEKIAWHSLFYRIGIAALCIVLAVTLFMVARDVASLRQRGAIRPAHARDLLRFIVPMEAPTSTSTPSVANIRDWMTFDYLNKAFRLPPAFLKASLEIRDARYPGLSIRQYASRLKVTPSSALERIRNAIAQFQSPSSTPR
jgi:hypothetical protein